MMDVLLMAAPGALELLILLGLFIGMPIAIVVLFVRVMRGKGARVFPAREPPSEGRGDYGVVGFDKNLAEDREMRITAASLANAKVKAELQGVIVTSVKK